MSAESPESPLARFCRAGVAALSDSELLSLLVGDSSAARDILRDGLPAIARTEWSVPPPKLPKATAARIAASLELARRVNGVRESDRVCISDPEQLARSLIARYSHHVQERLGAVYLDSRNRVLHEREVFIGTINSATVSTRDVLKIALDVHAASLIVFHNHPSGDPSPSADDLVFTRKLVEAGKLLGIDVLDHLVLGVNRYVSLRQRGAM